MLATVTQQPNLAETPWFALGLFLVAEAIPRWQVCRKGERILEIPPKRGAFDECLKLFPHCADSWLLFNDLSEIKQNMTRASFGDFSRNMV